MSNQAKEKTLGEVLRESITLIAGENCMRYAKNMEQVESGDADEKVAQAIVAEWLRRNEGKAVAWRFQSDVGMLVGTDFNWCEKTHLQAGTGSIEPLFLAPQPAEVNLPSVEELAEVLYLSQDVRGNEVHFSFITDGDKKPYFTMAGAIFELLKEKKK